MHSGNSLKSLQVVYTFHHKFLSWINVYFLTECKLFEFRISLKMLFIDANYSTTISYPKKNANHIFFCTQIINWHPYRAKVWKKYYCNSIISENSPTKSQPHKSQTSKQSKHVLLELFMLQQSHVQNGKSCLTTFLMVLFCILGPFSSAFVNKYGCRAVTIAGTVIAGVCLILSVFATNIYTLYVTIGLGTGFGLGEFISLTILYSQL